MGRWSRGQSDCSVAFRSAGWSVACCSLCSPISSESTGSTVMMACGGLARPFLFLGRGSAAEQPVGDEDLQDRGPTDALPAGRQSFGAEAVQAQWVAEFGGRPTTAPLTRSV